jgi:NAD(P)-dependent dehydrogenase (short-subunit alcohol dehydrogenase family)
LYKDVHERICSGEWLGERVLFIPCKGEIRSQRAKRAARRIFGLLTVQLAYLLRDTAIKVNSADPGYTATDLNGHRGTQTIPEGAAEAIRLALLPDDGPTGTYSDSKGIVPW